jgi:hypothetical protein
VAEGEDEVASSPLAKFYADLAAPEMSAAKPLSGVSMPAATLFSYDSGGERYRLQIQGGANASGGVVYAFLYDADGRFLAVESQQMGSNNPHFYLQPFFPKRGRYFVRLAALQPRIFPLEIRGLTRAAFGNRSLELPLDACDAVPTRSELDALRASLPDATREDAAAAGITGRTFAQATAWKKLAGFRIQRFERDEASDCSAFADGCGGWTETEPTAIPSKLRTGALFLAREASTRNDVLFASSRLDANQSELRLRSSMGVARTENASRPVVAQLGPQGFLTPNGRGPDQASPFYVTDQTLYIDTKDEIGRWDGIIGKDCVRLVHATSTTSGSGVVRRSVLTLGATFGQRPPPVTTAVKINEVMAEGASATDEFVELFNAGATPHTLDGYELVSVSGTGAQTSCWKGAAVDVIPPNGMFVLGSSAFSGPKRGSFACSLAPASGRVGLKDAHGRWVDGLGWGTAELEGPTEGYYGARAAGKRTSLSRRVDGLDTNVNASDFRTVLPTPGAPNAKP